MKNFFRNGWEDSNSKQKWAEAGDIVQFYGGRAYKVTVEPSEDLVVLKPYRSWHPVSFPGKDPYEDSVWEDVEALNRDLVRWKSKIKSIDQED
ncbi:hypothetical protein LCM20_07685 [Halobacillus litoralis]|uniref:hypothetical protein n=1 Tax=Halobacillus litoralis TaxID=45668 RepID=UPI001CD77338|nr:hypothetical protein [Halobacillus litoralis]MCA0970462.1 hypothetical protein [Halobacillus litoralis]